MIAHDELRKAVEQKFGEAVVTAKQCRQLEGLVFDKTNRKISNATLRRFFGLLPSKSKLSAYSLDTLRLYVGTVANNSLADEGQGVLWQRLEEEAAQFTKSYVNSIKMKSLSQFSQTIRRERVENGLNDFLSSGKGFLSLVASGGYGKSTSLAKWIVSDEKLKNDIILFTSALIFKNAFQYSNINTRVIDFSEGAANSLALANKDKKGKERFIIVVDAIDELSHNVEELRRFVGWFIDFLQNVSSFPWVKVVFSVRSTTYSRYIEPLLKQGKQYQTFKAKLTIPLFSTEEVFAHIHRSFSGRDKEKVLAQLASPSVFSLLQVPINLALFQSVIQNITSEEAYLPNLYKLMVEFHIYKSYCSEEKSDIIDAILQLLHQQNTGFTIKKNLLKKQYPIHLKKEGEYYFAYNELTSNGLLYEVKQSNGSGFETLHVGFKHINFYYYLSAIYLVHQNNGLTKTLFDQIASSHKNLEFKTNVIGHLFNLAFNNQNFDALENFYSLEEEILSTVTLSISVGMCLRQKSIFSAKLVEHFAQQPKGQKYLFELFVDTDHLITSFNDQLAVYAKYKEATVESSMFVCALQLYHSLLLLDKKTASDCFLKLDRLNFDEHIYPWPLGRKMGYSILHLFYSEHKTDYRLDYILKIRDMAYKNHPLGCKKECLFDITVIYSLVLTGQYKLAFELSELVIGEAESLQASDGFKLFADAFHLMLIRGFHAYSKFKQGQGVDLGEIQEMVSVSDASAGQYSSFQYICLLYLFLSDMYSKTKEVSNALFYYDRALKMSEYARYDLLSVKILLNHPFGDRDALARGRGMLEGKGIDEDSFLL